MRVAFLTSVCAVLAACSSSSSDNSTVTITPSSLSAPADGTTAIKLTITATAKDGSTPYSGQLTLTCTKDVQFGGASGPGQADNITLTAGASTETVTCASGANCVGTDTITGRLIGSNGANSGSVQIDFTQVGGGTTNSTGATGTTGTGGSTGTNGTGSSGTTSGLADSGPPPEPGAINALTPLYPYMGVNYQTQFSQNIENQFSFQVMTGPGTSAVPVPGAVVTISTDPNNPQGSFLVEGDGGAFVATASDAGIVSVYGQSGTVAGTFKLYAAVNGTDYQTEQTSAIVGTQPSAGTSSISCSPFNVPAFTGHNFPPCSGSLETPPNAADVTCTVQLVDRFNNNVGVPVSVNFYTEAGSIQGSTVVTPAFGQPNAGQATVTINPAGNAPIPVTPFSGEPVLHDPNNVLCPGSIPEVNTFSPRQGLVTIVAVFDGEEPFDTSSVNVWGPGVMFSDYPAPFVDSNDTNVFQAGDICVAPVAGGCAAPNGVWDANAKVFVQTRVLFTGFPASFSPDAGVNSLNTGMQLGDAGSTMRFSVLNFAPTLDVANGGYQTISVTYADINLNYPTTEDSSVYACGQTSADTNIQVSLANTYFAEPGATDIGMSLDDNKIPTSTAPAETAACDAGLVTTDAGSAMTVICHPYYTVSAFKGGYATNYQVTDSMNMDGPQPIDIRATFALSGQQAGADLLGIGN